MNSKSVACNVIFTGNCYHKLLSFGKVINFIKVIVYLFTLEYAKHVLPKSMTFSWTISYFVGSTIIMTCSESTSPLFKFKTNNGEVYIFTMASRRFCGINISTGTIICLTFLSILMSYLVVGKFYKIPIT